LWVLFIVGNPLYHSEFGAVQALTSGSIQSVLTVRCLDLRALYVRQTSECAVQSATGIK